MQLYCIGSSTGSTRRSKSKGIQTLTCLMIYIRQQSLSGYLTSQRHSIRNTVIPSVEVHPTNQEIYRQDGSILTRILGSVVRGCIGWKNVDKESICASPVFGCISGDNGV